MNKLRWLTLLPSTLLFALLHAANTTTNRERQTLDKMGIASTAKVEYLDIDGKAMSFDQFMQRLVAGKPYEITNDTEGRLTSIRMLDPNLKLPLPSSLSLKTADSIPVFDLLTLNGKRVTNATIKGRKTLLTFFFAECTPCIAEVPALNAYARENPRIHTFAVTFEGTSKAAAFKARWHLDVKVLANAKRFIDQIGVKIFPTFVLVDADGNIEDSTLATWLAKPNATLTSDEISKWVGKTRRK